MIPKQVRQFLWSYKVEEMNLKDDIKIIVFNILNYGNWFSVKWLFKNYSQEEIIKNANLFPESSWDKKSLNFWKIRLGISPQKGRF
jgi:hypothetical protein